MPTASASTRDDNKAAEWYQLAADRGDRDAMFALAMFRLGGRGGPANREEAAKLLAAAAKLGHAAGRLRSRPALSRRASCSRRISHAPPNCSAAPPTAGNPEAQYALATLYKEGRGVPKDTAKRTRLLAAAALADNTDAQVEYAHRSVQRHRRRQETRPRPPPCSRRPPAKAARSRRTASRAFSSVGRGMPADPVEAIKWHLVSKAGGASDLSLDDFMRKQKPDVRAAGEKAAAALDRGDQGSRGLDGDRRGGSTGRVPCSRGRPTTAMLRSALLNVMIKAARKAARTLKRDFGEVEHLQVSLKGPANFVTAADRRAEADPARGTDAGASRLRLPGRGRRTPRRPRQDPYLDRRSARRHLQFPARHPAFRDLDRARARGHDRRRRRLQPGQ